MSLVVFLGPSLPLVSARQILAADYRPPVACGDVYQAVQQGASRIAIIDGYFDGRPSVWHKEILWALNQGVKVYGGASMGALRAAELADFGMIGIGKIYQDYHQGRLEDDAEVAVLHGPAELNYRPLNEALVNIRATLALAVHKAVLSAAESERLLELAQQIYYRQRSWNTLLEQVQTALSAEHLQTFQQWLSHYKIDQKQCDARLILRYLRRVVRQPPLPEPVNFSFEPTQSWQALITWQSSQLKSHVLTDLEQSVLDELRLAGEYPRLRQQALLRCYLQADSTNRYADISHADELKRWQQKVGSDYLTKIEKSPADMVPALTIEAKIRQLQSQYRAELDHAMIALLIVSGDYPYWLEKARNKQQKRHNRSILPPVLLLEWLLEHYPELAQYGGVADCVQELGYAGIDELVQLAARQYVID